jgi:hypothetical protein
MWVNNVEEENVKKKRTRKPMSNETKAKIRKARRNRVKQPREGQSNKSKGMYSQLKKDYGDLIKTNPDVAAWFEKNKDSLKNDDSMEYGVLNDYKEMYISWREFKLSKIHFGKNAMNIEEDILSEDSYAFMDEETELEEEEIYENVEAFSYYIEEVDE